MTGEAQRAKTVAAGLSFTFSIDRRAVPPSGWNKTPLDTPWSFCKPRQSRWPRGVGRFERGDIIVATGLPRQVDSVSIP